MHQHSDALANHALSRSRCEGPSPLLQPRHRARAQPRPVRGQPPPAARPPREGSPRAQGPHSHFADGSSPVDAQVIELTMAKTFVASAARGLGALLLITLALANQPTARGRCRPPRHAFRPRTEPTRSANV